MYTCGGAGGLGGPVTTATRGGCGGPVTTAKGDDVAAGSVVAATTA